MAEVAAHLTDAVIPHLPVRQWVLSVPKRLRPFLHQTPEVASAVLAIFLRALRSALRDASPGAPAGLRDVQFGAISFPQRFGNSLHPHYHYHVLALDGVISGDVERGVRFHEATGLEARDAEALARTVQLRVLRWFARRGLLDPSAAADMPGTRRRRVGRGTGGFSVDGSVRIEGEDRAGLERDHLHWQVVPVATVRGGLSPERLHAPGGIEALTSPDARLVYRLPEPDMHGRQELRLMPHELLDRLARLVPPPRIHRHRYHGVLARIYQVLPLLCPACGGEMKIISFITLPSTVQRILLHLDLPHRPPRVSPARGPPQAELHLDQSPAFDLAAPEPIPELPPLRSGEPAGSLLCSSTRDSARTGSSSISRPPMTGRSEARAGPIRALPACRTRPSPTAHRTILRTPIPMALRPPPLRLLPGASRALGTHRHPRLFDSLHGQTSPPTLPPSLRGLLNRLFLAD